MDGVIVLQLSKKYFKNLLQQEKMYEVTYVYYIYRNSLFFHLVNFREKYSCKIIFVQITLYENIFTIHAWWALIEKVASRAGIDRSKWLAAVRRR